jgi:8-oxo-dGTP pyrophosphatase MutT (NUDIX family)
MCDSVKVVEGFGQDSKMQDSKLNIVGTLFLLRDDSALLMQLRDEKPDLRHAGMWVPPGGHIEADETVEQGTVREFLEETDYLCEKINWLQMMEIKHPEWPTYLLGVFWAPYDGIQKTECREGQALKFNRREDANMLLIPPFIFIIWDKLIHQNIKINKD